MKNLKNERITIRLTVTQKKKIVKKSNDLGFSISQYMLKCVFSDRIIFNNKILLQKILSIQTRENRVENNLNQLVKNINTEKRISDGNIPKIEQNLTQLNKHREILNKQIAELLIILKN